MALIDKGGTARTGKANLAEKLARYKNQTLNRKGVIAAIS